MIVNMQEATSSFIILIVTKCQHTTEQLRQSQNKQMTLKCTCDQHGRCHENVLSVRLPHDE